MADPTPAGEATKAAANAPASTNAGYKAAKSNPALRMMGIPNLPKRLPSRNWMIFWTLAGSLSATIIYDKREKKRATARWARAVSHLAKEPLSRPNEMPRKLTIYLESPPTDGLRVAQDHYTEYIKPILAASGLDWEFVQGRKEGDVRAAVAERIRRTRNPEAAAEAQTQDEVVNEVRKRNRTPEYTGIGGDIVIGRHTWKEYVRGLHEGWLGPLTLPLVLEPVVSEPTTPAGEKEVPKEGAEEDKKPEEKKPEEKKSERPPQPPPYNSTSDYPTSSIPMLIPAEFSPSVPIQFPHILGFMNTFIRLGRFLNRRHLADDIGREVAAVCFATAREYREEPSNDDDPPQPEQLNALSREEKDWPKSVWKEAKKEAEEVTTTTTTTTAGEEKKDSAPKHEQIWTKPVVLDPRIAMRMRRFELQPDDEARARATVVPEEEVEGWIKGHLRSLWRWAVTPKPKFEAPFVGDVDE